VSDQRTTTDLLGVAPIGRAVERLTDSVFGGLEAVLGRVCLPAAEELGLHYRDKVSQWRSRNMEATLLKAAPLLEVAAAEGRCAPPRLVMRSLNSATWAETAEVQELWAGLIASSCTNDGSDESNWIFICLLEQLTSLQVVVLKFACESADKVVLANGLFSARGLFKTASELAALTNCDDLHRLDRELDHLRELGLIHVGFQGFATALVANIQPTTLALHLYVRAQGSLANPIEFFSMTSEASSPA
jgi:hypothetical protein